VTRGLVLGGGGVTGVGWELGVLAGLAEAGVDVTGADVVIGTSAGSVVGAQICSGADLEALYARQLEPPTAERVAHIGPRVQLGWAAAFLRSRHDPEEFGRRLGALALAAQRAGRTPTLESRLAAIRSRLPSVQWSDRDLRITVVDAHSGRFRVLTRADGLPLLDVVAASCAVPGVYPTVPLDGRAYVDGGARTVANADLARGCSRVVALTPIGRTARWVPGAQQQLDALGVPAAVVTPDEASVAAIGSNVLDPAARAGAARAGRAQGLREAARVAAVWN
jgi:NTE family protein